MEQVSTTPKGFSTHSRLWKTNRYIYPVLSRRSRGISLGINLNQDKLCNFGCVYCEVNRAILPYNQRVDLVALERELRTTLELVRDGSLLNDPLFADADPRLRRVTDIAFSGDGEPTSFNNFPETVALVLRIRDELSCSHLQLVVITNASLFHRRKVREGLAMIQAASGEVWAKLDAGTPEYFKEVDQTVISFERIWTNLRDLGKIQPLVIQSCFMRLHGIAPNTTEISAYCTQINDLLVAGTRLTRVQIYTVSRPPAESYVTSLSPTELHKIVEHVAAAVPLPVEEYGGSVGLAESSARKL